ncbi:hypothetical protein [Leptospira sp. GIMC2001]|uniref:hypothetical protein n=1 Tax=Leptospira sp. GIMC2001 TaxID=1513297 RepID=UPI00234BEA1E|nr:hypothetical protein [Leptospira sp. GIMC2001]WCL49295.1 hypothetical protein O4O04_18695 [Leptospira sp. GIMC2001]
MEEDISLIIGLFSWTFIFGLIFLFSFILSKKKLKIQINPSTGRLELFIGKDLVGEVSTSIIQEIRLSQYTIKHQKSSNTYYTYSVVLEESTLGNLKSKYPKFDKIEKDYEKIGFLIEKSADQIKIRERAEDLSKSTGIPLRNREGVLRQANELDLPYHETMKGKVEMDDFPPRYRPGDLFEISLDGRGLTLTSHDKSYLLYIPIAFLLFISSMFFIASGSYELFYIDNPDIISIVFAFIFNSHIIFAVLFSIYVAFRVHFPKPLRIEKGILKYGYMKIPISKIEEVSFAGVYAKFLTDEKSYKIFLPFLCHLKNSKVCFDLIQKAILYQGMR